ncbi:hypothetical protein BpHYR1_028323 [Brachionus plicatilis]|uniref:Uncharacterized protein n=1 Tax=Brachionus plicatilis TaxID=10195 RepID=A0A3M7R3P7_BRAPC|nr:hypothetical protein BpHYR1_028323 [Brachionus plicatilis]
MTLSDRPDYHPECDNYFERKGLDKPKLYQFKLKHFCKECLIHLKLYRNCSILVTCSYVSKTGFHFDLYRLMRHVLIVEIGLN